jgi:alpha-galactosidase
LYRLISPRNNSGMLATETVAKDRSQVVVFAFANATIKGRGFPSLQLLGLDPQAKYRVAWIEGKGAPNTPESASGAWWMHHGIQFELLGDYQAAAFRLDRQP